MEKEYHSQLIVSKLKETIRFEMKHRNLIFALQMIMMVSFLIAWFFLWWF